jgi:hypothetical protein
MIISFMQDCVLTFYGLVLHLECKWSSFVCVKSPYNVFVLHLAGKCLRIFNSILSHLMTLCYT